MTKTETAQQPMIPDQLKKWLTDRGVREGSYMTELLDFYAGRTEDQMDAIYAEQHGDMA